MQYDLLQLLLGPRRSVPRRRPGTGDLRIQRRRSVAADRRRPSPTGRRVVRLPTTGAAAADRRAARHVLLLAQAHGDAVSSRDDGPARRDPPPGMSAEAALVARFVADQPPACRGWPSRRTCPHPRTAGHAPFTLDTAGVVVRRQAIPPPAACSCGIDRDGNGSRFGVVLQALVATSWSSAACRGGSTVGAVSKPTAPAAVISDFLGEQPDGDG